MVLIQTQLNSHTCRTSYAATLAWAKFDVVHDGTYWHVTKWQCIAHFDVGLRAALQTHANFKTLRGQDVRLASVFVMQQRDTTCAVRVVLDGSDLCFVLVGDALEVDEAVLLLVSATLVT